MAQTDYQIDELIRPNLTSFALSGAKVHWGHSAGRAFGGGREMYCGV